MDAAEARIRIFNQLLGTKCYSLWVYKNQAELKLPTKKTHSRSSSVDTECVYSFLSDAVSTHCGLRGPVCGVSKLFLCRISLVQSDVTLDVVSRSLHIDCLLCRCLREDLVANDCSRIDNVD